MTIASCRMRKRYRTILTSHHRVLYRQVDGSTLVYAVAGQTQDFQALLLKRLFRR